MPRPGVEKFSGGAWFEILLEDVFRNADNHRSSQLRCSQRMQLLVSVSGRRLYDKSNRVADSKIWVGWHMTVGIALQFANVKYSLHCFFESGSGQSFYLCSHDQVPSMFQMDR
jgi:hypothetical protein